MSRLDWERLILYRYDDMSNSYIWEFHLKEMWMLKHKHIIYL